MEIYKAILDGRPAAKALKEAIEEQVAADILSVRISHQKITVSYENNNFGTTAEVVFMIEERPRGFGLTEVSYKIDGEEMDEKFGASDLMIEEALCEEYEN